MSHWSEKYLNIPYLWESRDLSKGSDCLRLIEVILKNEKNYKIEEHGPVAEDWYKSHPSRLIERAITHGEIITDIKDLREFDTVFFNIECKCVDHVGIIIDNYGRFLHQLIKKPSRIDNIRNRIWRDKFHCGVRIHFAN